MSWMFALVPLGQAALVGYCAWYAGESRTTRRIGMVFTIAAGLIGLVMLIVGWTDYFRLVGELRAGEYQTAIGYVEKYSGDDDMGHRPETFSVGLSDFSFRGVDISPAFHHSVALGGPELTGKCVRVLYDQRQEILWLGVRESIGSPCQA
ncbi:MAG: hypothetical protein ABUS57_03215 [Pseudomonadota bacterium]